MKYGLPINFFKEYMCDHIWWNSYINNNIVNENKDIWKSQLVKSLYYDDNVEIHIDIIKGEPTVQDFQKVSEKYLKKYLQIPNTFQKYLDTKTENFSWGIGTTIRRFGLRVVVHSSGQSPYFYAWQEVLSKILSIG